MSGYIGIQPVPQATQTRDSFTATSGQTSFATGGYTPNFLDVYLNGVKLAAADYTASNGSDVVLASGAATGDILEVVAFTTFNSASSSIDDNGNATAITIDSSENVLIGTTDSTPYDNTSGNGILLGDGLISSAQEGGNTAIFNRMTSDGSIVQFRKDGSTVGSIGTSSSVAQYSGSTMASFGAGDVGIFVNSNNDAVYPVYQTTLSGRDAAIDLGLTTNRYKDAYLSGGIYLGGTGSANKLEDYEEGTWTPILRGSGQSPSGQNYNVQSGSYTKVGRKVHLQCYVSVNDIGSSSMTGAYAYISNFPFTIAGGNDMYSTGSFSYIHSLGQNVNSLHAYGNQGAAFAYVVYQNGAGITSAYLSPAGWGSNPTIMFSMTYFTS